VEPAKKRPIRTFRDLVAWQKAIDLTHFTYGVTRSFPPDEKFGLVVQMRRAAVSVAANIAEGFGRGARQDYIRFIQIARGSLFELQSHVEVARLEGWISHSALDEFHGRAAEVDRIISGRLRSLKTSPARP